MNRILAATTVCMGLASAGLAGAAPAQTTSDPDSKIGTRIMITGCLHEGTEADSFVLLGVTERPADGSRPIRPVPLVIYWLNSTRGLKGLTGDFVDITGKVTGRRGKPGTVTVSMDASETRSTDVRVASGNKDLDVTTEKYDNGARTADATRSSSLEVTRPVYTLDVDDVRLSSAVPDSLAACR